MPLATTISGRRHAVNWPTVLRDRTSASPHRKANRIAEAAFAGLSLAILAAGFLNAQPTHAPRGRLAPVSAPRWEHVALSTTYFWVKVWRVRWVNVRNCTESGIAHSPGMWGNSVIAVTAFALEARIAFRRNS